eukprot:scaffold11175_cov142-Isochrysis_galbana.AAC.2
MRWGTAASTGMRCRPFFANHCQSTSTPSYPSSLMMDGVSRDRREQRLDERRKAERVNRERRLYFDQVMRDLKVALSAAIYKQGGGGQGQEPRQHMATRISPRSCP